MSQLYTSSRLRVLRACLRAHYYRYTLGVQTPATPVMEFGTVGHRALEAYYLAWRSRMSDADRLDAALTEVSRSRLSHHDIVKLSILIRAYDARWGAEDWEVLDVEREFRYMLGERLIGGKIDAIIRNRADGRVYVVEHKTTGADTSAGSAYWDRLAIDTQVSIYIDGAAIFGYDIAGCIYDVIKRPEHEPKLLTPEPARKYTAGKGCKACGGSAGGKAGIIQGNGFYTVTHPNGVTSNTCIDCKGTGWKLDTNGEPQAPRLHAHLRDADETPVEFENRLVEVIAERPDDFLMRGVVVRLDGELPLMRQDILDDIDLAETGLRPRNSDACVRGRSVCGYLDACIGRASIDDEIRFPRGRAHPELAATSERG